MVAQVFDSVLDHPLANTGSNMRVLALAALVAACALVSACGDTTSKTAGPAAGTSTAGAATFGSATAPPGTTATTTATRSGLASATNPATSATPSRIVATGTGTAATGTATAKSSAKPVASSSNKPASSTTATAPPHGCATAAACGFPSAADTGPRLKTLTPRSGDLEIRDNGAVISGWDLKGSLDIWADNVTIVDSRITSHNWWAVNLRAGHHNLKVLHSTLVGSATAGPDNGGVDYGVSDGGNGKLEVGWCDLSLFGADFAVGHGNIHDNYTHDQAAFQNLDHEWQHTDSLISGGADAGGLTVRHNTLVNDTPIGKGASASIGLFDDDGPVSNTVIDNNWIAGGAYALYGGDAGATGIRVTNNVFSPQVFLNVGYYGSVAHWNAGGAGNVFTGNRTVDGRPVTP